MPYQVELPHVGESVIEAVIEKWLVEPGQRVEKYDPLVEVVTDKVSMEVPSPASGMITKIMATAGETVPMGAVIAEMDAEDAPAQPAVAPAPQAEASASNQFDRIGTLVQDANVGPTGGVFQDTSLQSKRDAETGDEAQPSRPAPSQGRRLSPVVMRLAEQHGIDPSSVKGTGRGGRVTKADILAASAGAGASPVLPVSSRSGDVQLAQNAVKKLTAAHMARSWREIPHAWSAIEIDVTGMVHCRRKNRDAFRDLYGIDLTYLPFTVWAVAQSLVENRLLNTTWEGDAAILRARINVGIAVASNEGLVVPVVHDADSRGIAGIAVKTSALVARARDGRLELADVQGGTLTLNNTGALGSVLGGAIINHPQTAILTTEKIVKRPVVVSSGNGDEIAVRLMMNACLSFDHRVIDGAEASGFLQEFKRRIESIDANSPVE